MNRRPILSGLIALSLFISALISQGHEIKLPATQPSRWEKHYQAWRTKQREEMPFFGCADGDDLVEGLRDNDNFNYRPFFVPVISSSVLNVVRDYVESAPNMPFMTTPKAIVPGEMVCLHHKPTPEELKHIAVMAIGDGSTFDRVIPGGFKELPSLRILVMDCRSSKVNWKSLEILKSATQVEQVLIEMEIDRKDADLSALAECKSLRVLDLVGPINPDQFKNLPPNLMTLGLKDMGYMENSRPHFFKYQGGELKRFTKLKALAINMDITDELLEDIGQLKSLEVLHLSSSRKEMTDVPGGGLVNLTNLRYYHGPLGQEGWKFLEKMPHLKYLRITDANQAAHEIPDPLPGGRFVRPVIPSINAKDMEAIGKLKELVYLDFMWVNKPQNSLHYLGDLTKLQVLLSPPSGDPYQSLKNCKSLRLMPVHFSGPMPEEYKKLQQAVPALQFGHQDDEPEKAQKPENSQKTGQ